MNLIILLLPFQSFCDFYSDNRVSSSACGRGYTGVASTGDISSVFINPASLSLENKRQNYFEYTYKNNVEWDTNGILKGSNPNFSAGYAFSINEFFQIGITYRTEKSLSEEGKYLLTVISRRDIRNYYLKSLHLEIYNEDPYYTNGIGNPPDLSDTNKIDTIGCYNDMKISSFSIPIAINLKNIVRIGLDINYTTFYSKSEIQTKPKSETQTNLGDLRITNCSPTEFSKIIPKFGFIYSPLENLSFGITYTPKISESIPSYYLNTYNTNISPTKIGIGINYKFNSFPLSLSLDYIQSHNSIEVNLINRNDIHLGLEYDISNNFKLRAGLFTQRDYRNIKTQEYYQENFGIGSFNQIFTTLGFSYKINSAVLNLSLMDSHLLSGGSVEQTYFNTGMSYGF